MTEDDNSPFRDGAELAEQARREPGKWKTVATFSAEQTAEFFGGGQLGQGEITDPAIRQRMDRHMQAMRACLFNKIVPAVEQALNVESPETARRLRSLSISAERGDQRASQLMGVLLSEVLTQGLEYRGNTPPAEHNTFQGIGRRTLPS